MQNKENGLIRFVQHLRYYRTSVFAEIFFVICNEILTWPSASMANPHRMKATPAIIAKANSSPITHRAIGTFQCNVSSPLDIDWYLLHFPRCSFSSCDTPCCISWDLLHKHWLGLANIPQLSVSLFFFFVGSENLSRWLVTDGVNWQPHLQIHHLDCCRNRVCELEPVGSAYFLKCLLRVFLFFFFFFFGFIKGKQCRIKKL